MPELHDLLAAYAAGDAEAQRGLLDEVEPLLFGYLRSFATGPDAHALSVRRAHELLLAFHLRAERGAIRIGSIGELKRLAHAYAAAKRSGFLARLRDFGDPETGALAPRAPEIGARLRAALDPDSLELAVAALLGEPPAADRWAPVRATLARAGLLDP